MYHARHSAAGDDPRRGTADAGRQARHRRANISRARISRSPPAKPSIAKVDYTWPGPPLTDWPAGLTSGDNFSGRWEGTITAPEDGEYEIGVEGDDGFRLWLDGKLVVEDWRIAPALYKGAKVTLDKGQKVAVKIEYFQGTRGPRAAPRLAHAEPERRRRGKPDNTVETYLPAGADWYDFWTNERFTGGRTVSRDVPARHPAALRARRLDRAVRPGRSIRDRETRRAV